MNFWLIEFVFSFFRYAPDKVGRTDMNQENRIRLAAESFILSSANNLMNSWLREEDTWVPALISFFFLDNGIKIMDFGARTELITAGLLMSVQSMPISGKRLMEQLVFALSHTCAL
jgi:hypothetical protein